MELCKCMGSEVNQSWFDDDVTPQMFRSELNAGEGDITAWINSPGGDCIAAAQIYTSGCFCHCRFLCKSAGTAQSKSNGCEDVLCRRYSGVH